MRSVALSTRERLGLLARYAWSRPLPYRLAGIFAVAYTVLAAVDNGPVLAGWLLGLLVLLVGWGLTLAASNLTASSLRRYGRGEDPLNPIVWFELLFRRLPLSVARRIEFLMGGLLMLAGALIVLLSLAGAIRSLLAP